VRPALVKALSGAALLAALATPALAVLPDEQLSDPALESRAREISRELRCLVCQNQSIDDSNAELARDLRLLVRERLSKGDSNDQVFDYVTRRYGDFVRLRPAFKPQTYALWLAPAVLLLIGGVGTARYLANRRRDAAMPVVPLSADDEARLAQLMGDGDEPRSRA
jgi:cytochrome c-type biogenesis protein CcmH